MPATASTPMGIARLSAPSGNTGRPMRSRPYTPALLITAASSTVTRIGAVR